MFKLSFAILVFIIFLVLILVIFFFRLDHSLKLKLIKSFVFKPENKEAELNPDISTDNWDLHKLRLEKFRRSQYKGLTFFMSTDDRIYYLSEKGNKVYC